MCNIKQHTIINNTIKSAEPNEFKSQELCCYNIATIFMIRIAKLMA